jgi:hypothetical protein
MPGTSGARFALAMPTQVDPLPAALLLAWTHQILLGHARCYCFSSDSDTKIIALNNPLPVHVPPCSGQDRFANTAGRGTPVPCRTNCLIYNALNNAGNYTPPCDTGVIPIILIPCSNGKQAAQTLFAQASLSSLGLGCPPCQVSMYHCLPCSTAVTPRQPDSQSGTLFDTSWGLQTI